jgi:Ca-activated chloride channel family protein
MDKLRPMVRVALWTATAVVGLALLGALRLVGGQEPMSGNFLGQKWQIAEPGWLLLFLAIPFLVLARPVEARNPGQERLLLGLRLGWMGLLALALGDPTWLRARSEVAVVALVDVSSSVGEADLGRARALVARLEEEAARRRPRARLAVVRFAGFPAALPPGGGRTRAGGRLTLDRFSGPQREDSDLASALGFGLARLEPDRVGRLLLLSDGRPTRGDLLEQAERARRRGVRVFVAGLTAPEPPRSPDLAVASLDGPASIRPGAGFEIAARIVASHPGTARFRLLRDGKPADTGAVGDVPVRAGVNLIPFTTRLAGETPTLYRLQILPGAQNREPRNDSAILALVPEPRSRVLVLESAPDSTLAFRRALAAEQIATQAAPAASLPSWERLAGFDLLVLSDAGLVPGAALSEANVATLERFVRERGGGLLVSGRVDEGGVGPGSERFRGLLPLIYDSSEQKQEATLALGLIIDRSGSMSGPKMDLTKEAARGAAELMNPQDLITVVTFDSQAQTVVRLQPASNRQRILSDIAQIRASGGTNVLPGLQEAFDQLLSARARKKHAIVLSDGQSPAEGVRELVDEAAGGGITVSAVGVGDGADLALLQTIAARGGGRFYHTRDPASIPRIFTREAAQFTRSNLVEAPSQVKPVRKAQAIAGLAFASAPPLHGYTRSRAKTSGELLLTSASGDPLLARWQLGLGQVLAWTSDVTPRWSGDWMAWRHFSKFWGQVVRSALGHRATESLPLSVSLRADRALVELRAFDADDRPLPGLQGSVAVTDVAEGGQIPAQPTRSLPLLPTGAGVYQAEVSIGEAHALLFAGELRGNTPGGPIRLRAHGRLSVPPLRERLPAGADQAADALTEAALLHAVAARTGGAAMGTDLSPLFDPGTDRVAAWWPLRRWLLPVALVLFLAEIAARRVKFRRLGRPRAG